MAWAHKFSLPTTAWENSGAGFTSRAVNAGAAVEVGDVIVLWVPYRIASDTTVTVADDLGGASPNVYTEDTNSHYFAGPTWSNIGVRAFYCRVTQAGTPTITATFGGTVTFPGIFGTVRTGLSATPFQVSATPLRTSGVAGGANALVTNGATVTTPPVCIDSFAYAMTASSGYTLTAGTGYTSRLTGQNSTNNRDLIRTEDKRVTASGSNVATWTPNFGGVDCVALQMVLSELITAPTIQGGTANPAHGSTGNTVTGINFGASQTGLCDLIIGGQSQIIESWADGIITYTAVRGVNLNDVAVNAVVRIADGTDSDPYALTGFDPPSGYSYTTIATVNPTAANRVTGEPDLSTGYQVEYQGNSGQFVVEDDGSITATDYGSFQARIGVPGSGFGDLQTQTVSEPSTDPEPSTDTEQYGGMNISRTKQRQKDREDHRAKNMNQVTQLLAIVNKLGL